VRSFRPVVLKRFSLENLLILAVRTRNLGCIASQIYVGKYPHICLCDKFLSPDTGVTAGGPQLEKHWSGQLSFPRFMTEVETQRGEGLPQGGSESKHRSWVTQGCCPCPVLRSPPAFPFLRLSFS
jgi:hypothetical protein